MTNPLYTLAVIICLVLAVSGPAQANWSEKCTAGKLDLSTWRFEAYPQVVGTFQNTVTKGLDGNSYLVLSETTPPELGGCGFGMGLASQEQFTDVRVGAIVNVTGDASHSYHGLGARISYFMDDGLATGAPGIVASGYVMLLHWEEGPANLRIEVRKFVNLNENIMKTITEVPAPGLDNARSFYAELDVVGANPVHVTGSLYTERGGSLVLRTPALVDTEAADPWENAGVHDAVYASGVSIIFGANQVLQYPGFRATFDDISSQSDGPAAATRCPGDGAMDVPLNAVLRWTEGAFATSRDVWFGLKGAMQKVQSGLTGTSYAPASLKPGQTYQWRVDEIGPAGTVTGPVLTFTTGNCLAVEDFESCTSDAEIASAWPHNIAGFDYIFREMATVRQGTQAMRFSYQNQYEPFFTEVTHTFDTPQDWTAYSTWDLYLALRGDPNNAAQLLHAGVEDSSGNGLTAVVAHPYDYVVQSKYWRRWGIPLSIFKQADVDLAAITKLVIRVGDGKGSTQPKDDLDTIYIDDIRLCPPVDPNTN